MSHKRQPAVMYERRIDGVFDTHAHLYDSMYSEGEHIKTPEDILANAALVGVNRILIPADRIDTSIRAIDYVKKYDGVSGVSLYASVGIHPHEATSYDEKAHEYLADAVAHRKENKVCAIGEIGLDYYYDYSPRDVQQDVYRKQLELAYELDIPVILHEREAAGDSIAILKDFYKRGQMRKNPGVCHCCSCSLEISKELLKMGFYLGFDGPITYKNNVKTIEVLANAPVDRIVIETDSPYLTPVPNRGHRNEPSYILYTLERLAEVKNISIEEAARITRENGLNMYEIEEN